MLVVTTSRSNIDWSERKKITYPKRIKRGDSAQNSNFSESKINIEIPEYRKRIHRSVFFFVLCNTHWYVSLTHASGLIRIAAQPSLFDRGSISYSNPRLRRSCCGKEFGCSTRRTIILNSFNIRSKLLNFWNIIFKLSAFCWFHQLKSNVLKSIYCTR